MDFSNLKNKFLIIFCLLVFLFPFFCITGFCSEDVTNDVQTVGGLAYDLDTSTFQSGSNVIRYLELEQGYLYTISNETADREAYLCFANDIPAVGVPFINRFVLPHGQSYQVRASSLGNYVYFNTNSGIFTIYREELTSMDSAVSDLVDNVGFNNLWGVFNTGINYIVVVVLFAFGFFIIVTLIKKLRKGKGGI